MNYLISTLYNNIFKTTPKINDLNIILESNGTQSNIYSNNYTTMNDKLQTSLLNQDTNKSSNTNKYSPPNKISSPSTKPQEESPFSKFKIWGQKS